MAKKSSKPLFHEAQEGTLDEDLRFLDDYGSRDDIPKLEIEIGDTRVRILSAWNESGQWYLMYAMHWGLPIPGDKTTFRCAQIQAVPAQCLYCEGAEVYRDSNPDLYKKWMAKPRYDFNAIDLDEPEAGVQVMSLPPQAAEKILQCYKRYGDPTHPETGYYFTITKKKTGPHVWNVEYTVWPEHDKTALEDWSVLENLILLDEIYPAPSLEAQQKSLQVDSGVKETAGLLAGVEEDILDAVVVEDEVIEEESVEEEATEEVSASALLRQRLLQRSKK